MNRHSLGRQKALEELCERKDEENAQLKARIAELESDIKDLVDNRGGSFAYDAEGQAWVRRGFKIVPDSERGES